MVRKGTGEEQDGPGRMAKIKSLRIGIGKVPAGRSPQSQGPHRSIWNSGGTKAGAERSQSANREEAGKRPWRAQNAG